MLQPFSQIERAHRDTLISKAEGEALDRLSRLYGVPRPPPLNSSYWRRALQAAALGPRDRPGTFFEVLCALMEPWTEQTLTTCDIDTASPTKLIGGTPAGNAWNCSHMGRLIEVIGKGVFWSTGVSGSDLLLSPISTSYWKGAGWKEDESGVSVRILPFWWKDSGGIVDVYVDAEIVSIPPTYIQADAADADSYMSEGALVVGDGVDDDRPAGQPIGGALLADATEPIIDYLDGLGYPRGVFPGPIYLSGIDVLPTYAALLDSLCASGIQVRIQAYDWCSAEALGAGNLSNFRIYGQGVPGSLASLAGWSP